MPARLLVAKVVVAAPDSEAEAVVVATIRVLVMFMDAVGAVVLEVAGAVAMIPPTLVVIVVVILVTLVTLPATSSKFAQARRVALL